RDLLSFPTRRSSDLLETYYGSTKSFFNVDSGVIIEAFEEDPNFIIVILQDGDNTIESIRSIFSFELWRQFVASRAEEPMWKNRRSEEHTSELQSREK